MSDLTKQSEAMDHTLNRLRERLAALRERNHDAETSSLLFRAQSLLGEIEKQRLISASLHQKMADELDAAVRIFEKKVAR